MASIPVFFLSPIKSGIGVEESRTDHSSRGGPRNRSATRFVLALRSNHCPGSSGGYRPFLTDSKKATKSQHCSADNVSRKLGIGVPSRPVTNVR